MARRRIREPVRLLFRDIERYRDIETETSRHNLRITMSHKFVAMVGIR